VVRRRKLLVTAGALSATAFATTIGLGANFGLFGLTEPDSPVGRLDPNRAAATVDARVLPGASPSVATTTPIPRDADD
jgi:hypothetical protein